MKIITDFHIHSKYSYATSKFMDLEQLAVWGQLKGIAVMGTGDFTHPLWQQELARNLQEAEPGLFELNNVLQKKIDTQVYDSCKGLQRFMLSAEISTIFKRNGRCYKVHSLLFAPTMSDVQKISKKLSAIGNMQSDGRPIIGYDVKDLLKLVLEVSPDCMLIPAHIWTPHFGLLGSNSGFSSVHACFEELTEYVYAVEKGLSSNYFMNARLSELDQFAIVCNSDAHSVENLGREANLLDVELSYTGIMGALKKNDSAQLVAGIEFFPERGKYFGDGHRNCEVYCTPEQTKELGGLCPVCGKKLTIGVYHRVAQLADRSSEQAALHMRKSLQVAPLQDIIAQVLGVSTTSKKVQGLYHKLLQAVGNEFYILLQAPLEEIAHASNQTVALYIGKLRAGDVAVMPGYDGQYGKVIFE